MNQIADLAERRSYVERAVADAVQAERARIAAFVNDLAVGQGLAPEERQAGIDAGLAWKVVAQATVVYADRGITKGMSYGIAAAQAAGLPVEVRFLDGAPEAMEL